MKEFLSLSVAFSVERDQLFKKILHIRRGEEAKRAEAKDLSLALYSKIARLMTTKKLNLFSDERGFFVYNERKSRVIAVTPEKAGIAYFLITGIRMRAIHPRLLERLARVGFLSDHTTYVQPKVLDHEEYKQIIELLKKGMEKKKGGESR